MYNFFFLQNAKRFQEFVTSEYKKSVAFNEIEPEELNTIIGTYMMNLKKTKGANKGEAYEPETLTSIFRSLER